MTGEFCLIPMLESGSMPRPLLPILTQLYVSIICSVLQFSTDQRHNKSFDLYLKRSPVERFSHSYGSICGRFSRFSGFSGFRLSLCTPRPNTLSLSRTRCACLPVLNQGKRFEIVLPFGREEERWGRWAELTPSGWTLCYSHSVGTPPTS